MDYDYKILFEPGIIGNLKLKNKMIVPAMVTITNTEEGTPTERFIQYHEAKARGGWGMVITEDYCITSTAGGFTNLPGLWDDSQIPGHTELVDRVHKAGGKIACQIYHAGRQTNSNVNGVQCMAPSPLKDPPAFETPREMTKEDINYLVKCFGDAALRVKKCGFDAIEIHGAHGYLINQFNSPFSNKRSDEYGGNTKNRSRFACEVIRSVRKAVGYAFPVLFKMTTEEYVSGGLGIEECKIIAQYFEEEGIDAITISQGVNATEWGVIAPEAITPGGFIQNAMAIREVVNIPVIAVGRINSIPLAISIIEHGQADFVCMGRASLADPMAPKKFLEGNQDDIIQCVACVQGCLGNIRRGNPARCILNPHTNMEYKYDLSPAETRKNVAIIGGGVAGCEAAIVAATKGHTVTVYEKSDKLGGQWIAASIPPNKSDFAGFLFWQKRQLDKLGVQILLNKEFTLDTVKGKKPDVVLVSTGSKEMKLNLPGLDLENVVLSHDVLTAKVTLKGNNIVVIGGGSVGVETAAHIAMDFKKVTLLEMKSQLAEDGEYSNNYFMFKIFDKYKVDFYTKAQYMNYKDGTVTFKIKNTIYEVDDVTDIVIAVGSVSVDKLSEQLKKENIEVFTIGDANSVKSGYLNIQQGYEAALEI